MNKIRWFFMSKYKKLLYQIECAKSNGQILHLDNGVVIDFSIDVGNIEKVKKYCESTVKNLNDRKSIDNEIVKALCSGEYFTVLNILRLIEGG